VIPASAKPGSQGEYCPAAQTFMVVGDAVGEAVGEEVGAEVGSAVLNVTHRSLASAPQPMPQVYPASSTF
jgi:hypothetical protein